MHEVKGRQISVLTVMPTVAHELSQFPLSCTLAVLENLSVKFMHGSKSFCETPGIDKWTSVCFIHTPCGQIPVVTTDSREEQPLTDHQ